MTADDLRWLGLIVSSYGLVMWLLATAMRTRHKRALPVIMHNRSWRVIPRPPYDWERDGE